MWYRKYLIYVPGHGTAVFKNSAVPLLAHFKPGPAAPHIRWIKKHDVTVECCSNYDYLHRDIRVPYGADLTGKNVEHNLSEALGKQRTLYGPSCWHEFFSEDTKQGTSFRVFISLDKTGASHWNADYTMPAETSILALSGKTVESLGKPHCQIFFHLPQGLFSVLTIDHSPFHLLRFSADDPAEICARLKKHALFGIGASDKIKKMPLILLPKTSKTLSEHICKEPCWEIFPHSQPWLHPDYMLHMGLALAARDKDLIRHNRSPVVVQDKNYEIRGKNRLLKSVLATLVLCTLILAFFSIRLKTAQNRLNEITRLASAHETALAAIHDQRQKKQVLTNMLRSLKPLWHLPTPWHSIFQHIGHAMPSKSGIDGFTVQTLPDGNKSLQFKAWVRTEDWDSISVAQHKLEQSHLMNKVTLSEQRHNLAKNIVEFHVSCVVEKF